MINNSTPARTALDRITRITPNMDLDRISRFMRNFDAD
jgi:hypothetical protein